MKEVKTLFLIAAIGFVLMVNEACITINNGSGSQRGVLRKEEPQIGTQKPQAQPELMSGMSCDCSAGNKSTSESVNDMQEIQSSVESLKPGETLEITVDPADVDIEDEEAIERQSPPHTPQRKSHRPKPARRPCQGGR